jgi:hypothetical protein
MEALDHRFVEGLFALVEEVIEGAEVIGCFNDVVDADWIAAGPDGMGLEYESGLFLGQPGAFDAVRVVRELNLGAVVEPTGQASGLFLAENPEDVWSHGSQPTNVQDKGLISE